MTTELRRLAARQLGLLTRQQMLSGGMTWGVIRTHLRQGHLIPVRDGVYRVAGSPVSFGQAALAAVLAVGDGVVASHATAARLYGLDDNLEEPGGIEVLGPLPKQARWPGVIGHRSGLLPDSHRTSVGGVPVTTVERLAVDLSGRLTPAALGRLVDEAARRRLLWPSRLRSLAADMKPAPGRRMSVVREVLDRRPAGRDRLESNLEGRALELLRSAGLPEPVAQHTVRVAGRTFRIDFAYPALMVAIEVDGWEFHGRYRSDHDRDLIRRNLLVAAGWSVVHFTTDMPERAFVATVADLLTSRKRLSTMCS